MYDVHDNCALTDALMNTVDALVLILGPDGRVLQFNKACEAVSGFSAHDVVGRDLIGMLIPQEQSGDVRKVFADLSSPGTNRFENDWITADRRRRRIAWSNVSMSGPSGRVEAIVSTGIDVTDQRLLESRLAQADRLDSVGRLAAGIAHDFNNTLTSLCLRVDRLTARDLDPDSRTDVDAIASMIDRTRDLIAELLSFSRPRQASPVPLEVNAGIEKLHSRLTSLLDGASELEIRLTAAPTTVRMDPVGFEQVVTNLVANARDAMPTGGAVTITTTVEDVEPEHLPSLLVPAGLTAGRYVKLAVEDTGNGIDPADLARVFDPYFTTKPAGRGTGLGLATAYATITQSGGAITADSESGRGARFDIWLPLATDDATVTAARPPTDTVGSADRHLALVVDDDTEMLDTLVDELHRLGCEAVTATTGEQALRHLDAAIDLLLTDLQLPDIGGDELARRFLRHRPDLSVVFASGAPVARVQAALPDDAIVLRKPFTTADLVAAVREHRWAQEQGGAAAPGGQSAGTNR